MADGGLSRSEAASELLARRKARASFLEYNRYLSRAADDGEMPAEHHELLCEALQCVADSLPLWGEVVENLMVFMPPGSAKSTYATVRFPAWYLGRFDRRGVISASYNATLAEHFGKKVRNLVASLPHQRLFPQCALSDDTRAKGEWETQNGGFYFAVGVGGGVTGRRGDIAIGDDLIRGRADADSPTIRDTTWEWWKSDLRTRLKPKTARRVLIGTRWHEDDPSGRILPDGWNGESGVFQGSDGARWHVLCLPAEARENDPLGRKPGEWLWTQWFSPAYWEAERKAQGARNWSALYQQVPVPDSGGQFERSWFKWYDELPKRLNLYGASDFAVTEARGDYTEHGVAGEDPDGELWLVDWWSGRESTDHSLDEQLALMDQHRPQTWFGERGVIESAIGPARDKMMRERMRNRRNAYFTPIELLPVVGDKVARVASFRARARLGMVHLPRGKEWALRLVDQLCAFPAGTHDDMVDVCGLIGRGLDQMYSPARELTAEQRGVKPFTASWLNSGDRPATPAKRF